MWAKFKKEIQNDHHKISFLKRIWFTFILDLKIQDIICKNECTLLFVKQAPVLNVYDNNHLRKSKPLQKG